jgi:hypothetical protein
MKKALQSISKAMALSTVVATLNGRRRHKGGPGQRVAG